MTSVSIYSYSSIKSMIKRSLQDLRQKLDSMKKDKEAVESGINEYESKYS